MPQQAISSSSSRPLDISTRSGSSILSLDFWKHWWERTEQTILILVSFACMGASCGFERSLLPRMAISVFNETNSLARLNFVATFGLFKAIANAIAGPLADRFGRKPVLVAGCIAGLPVMPFILVAKSWHSITLMNAAFGLSQGLIGSSLFFLFIDLMGPANRGIAVGVGECTIYVSTALINLLAGHLAAKHGYRPIPFVVATVLNVIGLLATVPLQDTLDLVFGYGDDHHEQTDSEKEKRHYLARMGSAQPSLLELDAATAENKKYYGSFLHSISKLSSMEEEEQQEGKEELVPLRDIDDAYDEDTTAAVALQKQTSSATNGSTTADTSPLHEIWLLLKKKNFCVLCMGGLLINFKDGFAWGSFPVFFRARGMPNDWTSILIAVYPLCWGLSQIYTGAMSDIFGRKVFLLSGCLFCAAAMCLYALPSQWWGDNGDDRHFKVWVTSDVLLGLGTAMMYPSLQAGAADEANPSCRGLALGFYRFVRDMGYVVGAIVCGKLTDAIGYEQTFVVNGALFVLLFFGVLLFYRQSRRRSPVYLVRLDSSASSL